MLQFVPSDLLGKAALATDPSPELTAIGAIISSEFLGLHIPGKVASMTVCHVLTCFHEDSRRILHF